MKHIKTPNNKTFIMENSRYWLTPLFIFSIILVLQTTQTYGQCNGPIFYEKFDANSTCMVQSGSTAWEFGNLTTIPVGFATGGAASIQNQAFPSGGPFSPSSGGASFIGIDGSDNTNGEISTLTSPLFDISTLFNPGLEYSFFSNNTTDACRNKLLVEVFNGLGWSRVDSNETNHGNWVRRCIYLSSSVQQVRFSVIGNDLMGGSTASNDILIDNIIVREIPQAPYGPSDVWPILTGATSVNVSSGVYGPSVYYLQDVLPISGGGVPQSDYSLNSNYPYDGSGGGSSFSGLTPGEFYLAVGADAFYLAAESGYSMGSYSGPSGINDNAYRAFTTTFPGGLAPIGDTKNNSITTSTYNFSHTSHTDSCYTDTYAANPNKDIWYKIILDDFADSLQISLSQYEPYDANTSYTYSANIRFHLVDNQDNILLSNQTSVDKSLIDLGLNTGDTVFVIVESQNPLSGTVSHPGFGLNDLISGSNYTINIHQSAPLTVNSSVISNYNGQDVSCNTSMDGCVLASVGGGMPFTVGEPYLYDWGISTNDTLCNIGAGVYTVTVTDSLGNTVVDSVTVTEPTAVTATINPVSVIDVACFGDSSGSATVTPSGGTGAYSFLWQDAQTTPVAVYLSAGNYCATVTDDNGCTATDCIMITQPASAITIASITVDSNASCFGLNNGGCMAVASGGVPTTTGLYTYLWDAFQTTASATGLSAGNHCVTVTDSLGCAASSCVTITEPTAVTATITASTNVSCFNDLTGTITATGTGGTVVSAYTYLWGTNVGGQTSATVTGLAANVAYCVTVTDDNGCSDVACHVLTQPATPVISTLSIRQQSCSFVDCSTFEATTNGGFGPYSYQWYLGGVPLVSSVDDSLIVCQSGTYHVETTDSLGCVVISNIINYVHPSAALATTASIITPIFCPGDSSGVIGTTTSGGTAPYNIAWSHNASTTDTIVDLFAGVYCATVTDSKGCVDTACATLVEPILGPLPMSKTDDNCLDSNGTATATPPPGIYDFTWSNGVTELSVATSTITNLSAGIYCVTSTNISTGCINSACVTITAPAAPVTASAAIASNYNGQDISCNGASDGILVGTGIGGTVVGSYNYAWDLGATGDTLGNGNGLVIAGNYCVTVADDNGCHDVACITITEPSAVIATISSIQNVDCNGNATGFATVMGSWGTVTTGYTYLWDTAPIQTTATATGLVAGVYTATVVDMNGCVGSTSVTITEPSALNLNIIDVPISCVGVNNGYATANVTGGTPWVSGYQYLWSSGETTATITGLVEGIYCVTVTDSLSCAANACITITDPPLFKGNAGSWICDSAQNKKIVFNAIGGPAPYLFSIDSGSTYGTTHIFDSLASGVYYAFCINMNGCIDMDTVYVDSLPSGGILSSSSPAVCYGDSTHIITVPACAGCDYLWDADTTVQNTYQTHAGMHYMQIINPAGCITNYDSIVLVDPLPISLNFVSAGMACQNDSINLIVQASDGLFPYTFLWDNATNADSIMASPGIYQVTVTDLNGCTIIGADTILSIPFLDSAIIDNAIDPFSIGYCENATAGILNYVDIIGSTTAGDFYGYGVRNGLLGPGVAIFHPDSAVIDMGHTGNVTITYVYQTSTGCTASTTFTTEVHALPNLSFLNLPDSLCPDSDTIGLLMQNSVITGALGATTYLDTLASQAGIFTVTDIGGNAVPNFIGLFDSLNASAAVGYNQINVSYSYTADTAFGGCTADVFDSIRIIDCCVWPGDADSDGIANNFDILPIGLHNGTSGITRSNVAIDWNCKASSAWGTGISGNPSVDLKHVDCDGNGTIQNADTNAIILNWTQTHLKSGFNSPSSAIDIFIDTAVTNPGDTVSLDIILSSALQPTTGYGIAFTINYDPSGVDSNSVDISFDNSWLGDINSNMIGIYKDFYNTGEVEVGLTRINQTSAVGSGAIGQIQLIIKDDVLPKSSNSYIRLDFNISNIRFIDSLGGVIPVTPQLSQILVVDVFNGNLSIQQMENKIIAYPNPTTGLLKVESLNKTIDAIKVYDVTGQLLYHEASINEFQTFIDLNTLPIGMYILNVESQGEFKNIRVVKQ